METSRISPLPWSIWWGADNLTEYSEHYDPEIRDANGDFVAMMSYDTISSSVRAEIVQNAEAIVAAINARHVPSSEPLDLAGDIPVDATLRADDCAVVDGLTWTVHRQTTEPPVLNDTGDYISLPGVPVDYTAEAPPFHVGVVTAEGRGYVDGHLVEIEWGYVDPDGVWTECERDDILAERQDGSRMAIIRFVE